MGEVPEVEQVAELAGSEAPRTLTVILGSTSPLISSWAEEGVLRSYKPELPECWEQMPRCSYTGHNHHPP